MFRIAADLVIAGTGEGESGLQISPWWSPDVDGRFNVRTTDGEIACFGGRLPFYTFTGTYNLHYLKGSPIHLEMTYRPNGLSMSSPGTIRYTLTYLGNTYTSGDLPFDEGNPAEGHGSWGILDGAEVGAHLQAFMQPGNAASEIGATWANIVFEPLVTPVEPTSWGHIKALYR
jgi:hypothetical protein